MSLYLYAVSTLYNDRPPTLEKAVILKETARLVHIEGNNPAFGYRRRLSKVEVDTRGLRNPLTAWKYYKRCVEENIERVRVELNYLEKCYSVANEKGKGGE